MFDKEYGRAPKILGYMRKVLRLITSFLYVVMIVDTVLGLFKQPVAGAYLLGLLFACLILSYIFRDYSRRGVFLLISHIAMGVGCYFLVDNPYIRLLVFAVLIGYFVDGLIYIRGNYIIKRVFEAPWPCMIFGVITIALGYHLGNVPLQRVGYYMPVLIIFIFLVSLYIDGLEEYLNGARRVSGAPMKQIISVNSLIVTGIITVFVVTIVLGNLLRFDVVLKDVLISLLPILKILVAIIAFVLKFIFSILFGGDTSVTRPQMSLPEDGEENALGKILDLLFITVIIIVSVFLIILFFRWLIRLLLSRQRRRDDVTEELKVKRKMKNKKERFVREDKLKGSTPDMVARRLYKNRVLSFRRYFTPERYSTTKDIKGLIIERPALNKKYFGKVPEKKSEIDEENLELLTEMYEEVRYGEKMPDDSFLKRMKKIKL